MNPEKPVALVHAVGLDHQNLHLPNAQGRLHCEAAVLAYKRGEISKIVYNGGEYIRHQMPMAQAMEYYTRNFLSPIEYQDIITEPNAVTTRAEIRIFKKLCQERGWDNIVDISIVDQLSRIESRLWIEFGRRVPTWSVEGILGGDIGLSKGVSSRENILAVVDSVPVVGDVLDWVAHQIPSKCYWEEVITGKLAGSRSSR